MEEDLWTPSEFAQSIDRLVARLLANQPRFRTREVVLTKTGKAMLARSRRRRLGPPSNRVPLDRERWVRGKHVDAIVLVGQRLPKSRFVLERCFIPPPTLSDQAFDVYMSVRPSVPSPAMALQLAEATVQ